MAKRTIQTAVLWWMVGGAILCGQTAVIADSLTGDIALVDPEIGVVATLPGVPGVRRIASDGRGVFWATVPSAQAIIRIDANAGSLAVLPMAGMPLSVAIDPAGRPWFSLRNGAQGSVVSIDDLGAVVAAHPCLPSPDLLHIDAAGDFWITHGSGTSPGTLSHVSISGQLMGTHVLGGGCRAVARAVSGEFFALCQFPERLYRYTESGDLVAIIPLGPLVRDLALGDDGMVYLAYGGAGMIEMRDADGALLFAAPCPEQPFTLFLDEYGRVFHAGSSGFVTRRDRFLGYEASWPGTTGTVLCGDAGIGFARHAGRARDFDGDEFSNAAEFRAGSHRFDPDDAPAEFEPLSVVTPGATVPIGIRRREFPGALIWIGAAEAPLPRGSGIFGFSLPGGAAFELSQNPALGLFAPLAAWLDAEGRCTVDLFIPPEPLLVGIEFFAAFIAFPSFPYLGDADPSQAFSIVIR